MTALAVEQLDLFAPEVAEPRAMRLVQICHRCDQPLCATSLDDPSMPWTPGVLWGYVALQQHLADDCSASGRGG